MALSLPPAGFPQNAGLARAKSRFPIYAVLRAARHSPLQCGGLPFGLSALIMERPHRGAPTWVYRTFAQGRLYVGGRYARRASRHIATANAEWRGAQPQWEQEIPARAKPVEAGKPGLSGRCSALVWKSVFGKRKILNFFHRPPTKEDL